MDWKEYQTGRPKSMQSPLKKLGHLADQVAASAKIQTSLTGMRRETWCREAGELEWRARQEADG